MRFTADCARACMNKEDGIGLKKFKKMQQGKDFLTL